MPQEKFSPPIIPLPDQGRRLAIGDIHGCYRTLKTLLEDRLHISLKDQLFFLGDYINRGPDSAKVLDYLMRLRGGNYQVYPLRGNHEQAFTMAYDNGFDFLESYLQKYNSLDLFNESIIDYYYFCSSLAYCYFSGDFFLAHTGMMEWQDPSLDLRGMFSEVSLVIDSELLAKRYTIHGHQAISIGEAMQAVSNRSRRVNIDTGCVHKARKGLGHLCAFNLDTWELTSQKCIDK